MNTVERERRLRELRPYVERARRMEGWTFEFEPIPLSPSPPWDYTERARVLAAGARTVLDLGTGGGEVFSDILSGYVGMAVATESWHVNAPVAGRRLRRLGAHVVEASSLALSFAEERFELVLDRHEELDPREVARVLAPGGRVLTQQIHSDYLAELRAFFPRMPDVGRHDEPYRRGFEAAGLQIVDARQHEQPVAYRGLGELVYELTAAPWTIPDFDLEADLEALLQIEDRLGRKEGIVLSDRRYILEAYKPG